MADKPNRITVDLSQFPDLVVIYLGMRAKTPRGLRTLLSFGPKIQASVTAAPDGPLLHEYLLYSLSLRTSACASTGATSTRWSAGRTIPHAAWWRDFLPTGRHRLLARDVLRRRAVESVFSTCRLGTHRVAPNQPARGSLFSARRRLGLKEEGTEPAPVVTEEALYKPRPQSAELVADCPA